METTFNYLPSPKSSYKFGWGLSIFVIIIAFLAILSTGYIDKLLITTESIPNTMDTKKTLNFSQKPALIEAFIALCNIGLAIFVLLDLRFLRPINKVVDESPASKSFNQFLFGWQMLWLGWIVLYSCLAINWFGLLNDASIPKSKWFAKKRQE